MKRETRKFVERAMNRLALPIDIGEDILATDAEVKRLKREAKAKDALLRDVKNLIYWGHGPSALLRIAAALKPRKAKREHVCVTHSGDEQVTCDDPKCPRKRHG